MTAAPPPPAPAKTTDTGVVGPFAPVLREISRGGLAGLLTGFLMGGIGGRIAMRIASLIDRAEHSRKTENGFTVGEFTLEGTIELIIFGGLFTGLGMAVTWVIVQRWLPASPVARYIAAGVVGIALGGRAAIDGRNFDFVILDPPLGQAAIFVVLAALSGMALVFVDQWLDRRLPPARHPALAMYMPIALIGALIAVPTIGLFFNTQDCSCVSPPRLAGGFLIVITLLTIWAWVGEARRSAPASAAPSWLGRSALVGLVIAGLAHLAGEIAHFV